MAIQTQRFTPLLARHHKLATTQEELDEAARRQMAIDNNKLNAQAQMQNVRQKNANARFNAGLKERKAANEKKQDRQAVIDERNAEQTAYNRGQDALKQERGLEEREYQRGQDVIRNQQTGLQNRRLAKNDARLEQQHAIDMREDAIKVQQRQERKQLTDRYLSLGAFGSYMQQAKRDDQGRINLSELKDMSPTFFNGYEPVGELYSFIGDDGKVTFTDDNGPIKNDGSVVSMQSRVFTNAIPIADDYRRKQMGLTTGQKRTQARKDAYKDYEFHRGNAQKAKETLTKYIMQNGGYPVLTENANESQVQRYNIDKRPYDLLKNEINRSLTEAQKWYEVVYGSQETDLAPSVNRPGEYIPKSTSKETVTEEQMNAKAKGLGKRDTSGTNSRTMRNPPPLIPKKVREFFEQFYPDTDINRLDPEEIKKMMPKNRDDLLYYSRNR